MMLFLSADLVLLNLVLFCRDLLCGVSVRGRVKRGHLSLKAQQGSTGQHYIPLGEASIAGK
jgi:hypothetical protein